MFAQLSINDDESLLAELKAKSVLFDQIKVAQLDDVKLAKKRDMVQNGTLESFSIDDCDCLRFQNRICDPNVAELKELILHEAHDSLFTLHLGGTKNVSRSARILLLARNKKRRGRTDGQSEHVIQIWKDMLRTCVIDFESGCEHYLPLAKFVYNNSFQSKTEDIVKIIRDRLKIAFNREKSYVDLKRRDIEFSVGDKIFLKVSPWKKVLRFGWKGKLSPCFIGPHEIVERLGPVAYRLALPAELQKMHNVFHVSMLRRYRSNLSHVISTEEIEIQPNLSYEEELVEILAREMKELRNKRVSLVKVLWHSHSVEEATWEPEETMRSEYPHLFSGKF
ncbi:uncharacterized protein [Gossypium hirsutum]|uniref:Tf2-1-like SH3-like domain-containing protein n=1 Tax=Gossypium hirsutum TaxID=3635 RepID=A0A1U8JG09_GOSHI|nr:uncharacterized protein LOC107906635 [Gossypium hirsutum]